MYTSRYFVDFTNQYFVSLVFSYWTSSLDLLQSLLTQNNIPSLRIDGRVSYEQRLRALETFRNDPDVSVLLMSIQTGSVGFVHTLLFSGIVANQEHRLNIAIANRVHIIEPQWNPSVEEQAIGRALRMGQTRTVTVIRYSMNKTVEEVRGLYQALDLRSAHRTNLPSQNIRNMQRRKRNLAKFTLDGADGDCGTLEVGTQTRQSLIC
jgi:SWI/SNF-related matrix-associated actin-dependent regulator of chromatin subfamily A3